jgi:hypothetical protein
MKNFNRGLLFALLMMTFGFSAYAQKQLYINEVMVTNTNNVEDDYGNHNPWIEIYNASFSTVNIRSYYITTDKRVLDKNLSVPERAKMMYQIPKNNPQTVMPPRQHLILWADGRTELGDFHLNFSLDSTKSNWIALYDGNGFTLVDSVTVPAIAANCSYGMTHDGVVKEGWTVFGQNGTFVSPAANNKNLNTESKIEKFKAKDNLGFGMTVVAMLVVFFSLVLLYIAFKIEGNIGMKLTKRNAMKAQGITDEKLAEKQLGDNTGDVICAIGLALHEYQDESHDVESEVLTINRVKRNYSPWSSKIYMLRQWPRK